MVAYTCWFAPFFFFCLIYLVYNNLQYKETYTESLMTYCETAFALKFIYWFIFIFFVSILFASNMCEQSTINKAIWIQLFFFFIYSTVLLLPTPRFSGTFFFPHLLAMQYSMQDLSSPTRARTCTPYINSTECQPLDCQGSPIKCYFFLPKIF